MGGESGKGVGLCGGLGEVGGRAGDGVDPNVRARCDHVRHELPWMAKMQVAHRRRQRLCVSGGLVALEGHSTAWIHAFKICR